MKISKAARRALKTGQGMSRREWEKITGLKRNGIKIFPTNSASGCLIDGETRIKRKAAPIRRWQPLLEDYIADDWEA